MQDTLVITNAQVVMPYATVRGSVHIRDGVIQEIATSTSSVPSALDFGGDFLLPGMIDVHTDNLERHLLPRNNADWPVMAALIAHDAQLATAGITTVLDSMCIGTMGAGVRSFEKVEEAIRLTGKQESREIFRVEHLLHLRAELSSPEFPGMFDRLYEHEDLRLVSLMDHTPGQRQWANIDRFAAMERKDHKLSHEEMEAQLARQRENQKHVEPNRRYVLSMMDGRGIALASHDDTTLEHVEQAHGEGVLISEFPTTMLAAQAAHERGMQIVAGGPNLVLGRSHSGNVAVEELARAGLVDVLSSDYAPSSLLHGAFLLTQRAGIPTHEAIATELL